MNKKTNIFIIAILFIALAISARLLPHPANVTPIAALALVAGIYLPKLWAILAPLAAMFISDIFIGFYDWKIMIIVYGSFVLIGLIGLLVRKKKHLWSIIGGITLGSIIFFLATNGAVWLFGTLYPHTISGLIESYIMGLPFFRNSIIGNLFYTVVLASIAEFNFYLMKRNNSRTIFMSSNTKK